MALNKRQRMSMGVLAIGLMALVVDRMYVLPKSAPAQPAAGSDDYTVTATSERAMAPPPLSAPAGLTATSKLEAAWSGKNLRLDESRDLFSLPPSWPRARGPEKRTTPTAAAETVFAARHKLEAITMDLEGERALVDDKLLRLGDILEGFQLIAIDRESATFERDGQRVRLVLAKPQ
jgi:hypothetical protein